jgi:NADH:ubiquinone oxidoreductase subunit H
MPFYGHMCFFRSIKTTTHIVSHEIVIGLIVKIVLIHVGSCDFSESVIAQKKIWFGIPKNQNTHPPHVSININK